MFIWTSLCKPNTLRAWSSPEEQNLPLNHYAYVKLIQTSTQDLYGITTSGAESDTGGRGIVATPTPQEASTAIRLVKYPHFYPKETESTIAS